MLDQELPSPDRAIYANPEIVPEGWYIAARSKELKPGKPLRIKLLKMELVAYRDQHNQPHVLKSKCAHMGASLADGYVEDGCIVCPFHSFKYNSRGECVRMPSDSNRMHQFRVPAFQTVERWGQIWFWLGKEPAYSLDVFSDVEGHTELLFDRCVYHPHYHAMLPNGMDVTHFEAVHGVTVADFKYELQGSMMRTEMNFKIEKNAPWIFKLLGVKYLRLDFRCIGGNNYVVDIIAPVQISFLTSYAQRNEGGTLSASVAVFKNVPKWKKWTGLWLIDAYLRMRLVSDFFADDGVWINNLDFSPRFIKTDRYYIEFMRLCNQLTPYRP